MEAIARHVLKGVMYLNRVTVSVRKGVRMKNVSTMAVTALLHLNLQLNSANALLTN